MTAIDERTDLDRLVLLDFEPVIPCDANGHPRDENGCRAPEPAVWRVLVIHGVNEVSCDPVLHVVCDGRYRFAAKWAQDFFAPVLCPNCKVVHPVAGLCARCGKLIAKPEDLFVLVGAV